MRARADQSAPTLDGLQCQAPRPRRRPTPRPRRPRPSRPSMSQRTTPTPTPAPSPRTPTLANVVPALDARAPVASDADAAPSLDAGVRPNVAQRTDDGEPLAIAQGRYYRHRARDRAWSARRTSWGWSRSTTTCCPSQRSSRSRGQWPKSRTTRGRASSRQASPMTVPTTFSTRSRRLGSSALSEASGGRRRGLRRLPRQHDMAELPGAR